MPETIKKVDNIYYLQIGVQGENVSREVKMDVSEWVEKYPDGHLYILFKRYNDQWGYPVATDYEDGILTWTPSVADTSVPGVGYAEVRMMDNDTEAVRKSRIIPTVVENSVSGLDGAEVPSPFQEWTNQVLAAANTVVESLDSAIEAADRAEAAAESITGEYDVPITIDFGTLTSLPAIADEVGVADTMTVDSFEMSNPSAFTGRLTVVTESGKVTVSGTISGSSTLKIKLSATM